MASQFACARCGWKKIIETGRYVACPQCGGPVVEGPCEKDPGNFAEHPHRSDPAADS